MPCQICRDKKSEEWDDHQKCYDQNFNDLREPWEACPSFHQYYQGALSVDIANELLPLVERKYPNNKQTEVETLNVKLTTLCFSLQPTHIYEAKEVTTRVLTLIRQMRVESPMLPERYMQIEAFTYNNLGRIAHEKGTDDSAQESLVHFYKCLELSLAISLTAGIAAAEVIIAVAKTNVENGDIRCNQDNLKKYTRLLWIHCEQIRQREFTGNRFRCGPRHCAMA